jgi:hypothetical protein
MEENTHISRLFTRIISLINKQSVDRESMARILSDEAGFPITLEQFAYKKGTITLHLKPMQRTEIYLKKENIKAKIKENLGLSITEFK